MVPIFFFFSVCVLKIGKGKYHKAICFSVEKKKKEHLKK